MAAFLSGCRIWERGDSGCIDDACMSGQLLRGFAPTDMFASHQMRRDDGIGD
ncbi:MAG: hypothetical protein AB4352_08065 [Hormoscilla sp.]